MSTPRDSSSAEAAAPSGASSPASRGRRTLGAWRGRVHMAEAQASAPLPEIELAAWLGESHR